jgi:GTP-binding protein EngB required for normal cell division
MVRTRGSQISTDADEGALGEPEDAVANDTLKVIFVGMAMTGKTSMIKRLIEGRKAVIPKRDERTIGVQHLRVGSSQQQRSTAS